MEFLSIPLSEFLFLSLFLTMVSRAASSARSVIFLGQSSGSQSDWCGGLVVVAHPLKIPPTHLDPGETPKFSLKLAVDSRQRGLQGKSLCKIPSFVIVVMLS